MNLTCKNCATPLQPADINLVTHTACCPQCNLVFSVAEHTGGRPPAQPNRIPQPPPRHHRVWPKQSTIQITPSSDEVVLTRRWLDQAFGKYLWYWFAFQLGVGLLYYQTRYLGVPSAVLLGAVSLGLAYWLLVKIVNKTSVRVNSMEVQVTHGPLPFFVANRRLATSLVQQVYALKVVHVGHRNTKYETYDVWLNLTAPNAPVRLVPDLATSEEALYLEQQLETLLHLPDEPVEGELQRR